MFSIKRNRRVMVLLLLVTLIYTYMSKRGMHHANGVTETYTRLIRRHIPNVMDLHRETAAHGPQTEQRPLCLHLNPAVRKDELSPIKVYERVKLVCPGSYDSKSAWHVNFNAERLYWFRPFQVPESSTPGGFIFDHAAKNSMDLSSKRIPKVPKIIHFIWTDEIIPTVFVGNLKLFRATHSAWKIQFWTLRAGRSFIQQHEPQLTDIYDKLTNVFKADTLRYVLIYHIGGAYFDLDSKVIRPIDELAEKYDCVIGPEAVENAVSIPRLKSLLANSGFLCMQGHIFFRRVIDLIPVHAKAKPGPEFFSKCFNVFLDEQLNYDTAAKQEFEIKMAPHDYFEYTVNAGHNVDGRMKKLCVNYTVHVEEYLSLCQGVDIKEHSDDKRVIITDCEIMYDTLYQEIPGGKRIVFDACVEWISHGDANRKHSDKRFIDHVHYGTHLKHIFRTMDFKNENNISKVLPGIILHI